MLNVPTRKGLTVEGLSNSQRHCPTCRQNRSAEAFYRGCAECKDCKRHRSRQNRIAQTRKIIAFERFIGILVDLAKSTSDSGDVKTEAAA
jgi:hypothetical protein